MKPAILGPFLTLDDISDGAMHLAAVFVAGEGTDIPAIRAGGQEFQAEELARVDETTIQRVRFKVPADAPSSYQWAGEDFELAGGLDGDLRIAFASCNGEEHGDLDRDPGERNAMWARLCQQHTDAPFSILLHGGDQIYADEATKGHALSDDWPEHIPKDPSRAELAELRQHLRRGFLERYTALLQDQHYAWLSARVPSLAQWDDHDICDGWGSLPRSRTYSPVGQLLFDVAREMALLFQHGAVDGDLPPRFQDPAGTHLGWVVDAPDLRLLAPDLRSERTRRQVMGEGGWKMMEAVAERAAPARTLLLSSVPLLGPRLSVFETLMVLIPKMQKYEDDLRDQWQSRAHRAEWQRMLRLVCQMIGPEAELTALSGEIHLATRATMSAGQGRLLHQLVASGIAHRPPPKNWARLLGALASFGENPLPDQKISIERIPGQAGRYVADRNALLLTRKDGAWSAVWDFERSGLSGKLPL